MVNFKALFDNVFNEKIAKFKENGRKDEKDFKHSQFQFPYINPDKTVNFIPNM